MAAISAQDLANHTLFNLREFNSVNFGGLPLNAVGSPYSFLNLLPLFNVAIARFLAATGYAPALTETFSVIPVVDTSTTYGNFTLPTAMRSLVRVEYASGTTGLFTPLPQLSFDRFDAEVGLQYPNGVIGQPDFYREPFGGAIRFNPYPNAANVAAGDQLALYYMSSGTTLVNPTDVPNIPADYHEAIYAFALSRCWMLKNDKDYATMWLTEFTEQVKEAKRLYYDLNRGQTFGFIDDDDTMDGLPDSDLYQ